MPHSIHGFVVRADDLHQIEGPFADACSVMLRAGLAFVPLTTELSAEIAERFEQVARSTPCAPIELPSAVSLRAVDVFVAERLSRHMKIAYVETEYHGGTGFQFATTWASGRIVQEPSLIESEFGVGAINEALSQFGVQPMPERDLFDTVGLTWYRDMDEFENPESEYYHTDYLDRRDKEHGW